MRIVIIGCGRIGCHVARRLVDAGHEVCVVDHDPAAWERLPQPWPGRAVVGQGFDADVLTSAQVQRADLVAVLTRDDATNFMVACAVRDLFGVGEVLVRINDAEYAPVFAALGLRAIGLPELVLTQIEAALAGR